VAGQGGGGGGVQEAAHSRGPPLLWGVGARHARGGGGLAGRGVPGLRGRLGSAWATAGPAAGGGRLGRAFGLGPVR
jgi:hypothetical protein